jgi:hypothetical protein
MRLMLLGGSAYDRSTYCIRDYLSGKQPYRNPIVRPGRLKVAM